MMPFFFGNSERRLFGFYDPAERMKKAERAVLICAPWGNEYIFSHRTLRQLAIRLAQKGCHVLRFDYFATGDSAGDNGENDYAGSLADVETALSELKEISGLATVCLVGLRFGASAVAELSARRAQDVEALVLWEPLTALDSAGGDAPAAPESFKACDLEALAPNLPQRTMVLSAHNMKLGGTDTLRVDHVPGKPPWTEKSVEAGVIPVNALRHIIDWLE